MSYVEQELAKRRGKKVDASEREEKDQVDELYVIPDHLKVGHKSLFLLANFLFIISLLHMM